jgi:hypothetical protein
VRRSSATRRADQWASEPSLLSLFRALQICCPDVAFPACRMKRHHRALLRPGRRWRSAAAGVARRSRRHRAPDPRSRDRAPWRRRAAHLVPPHLSPTASCTKACRVVERATSNVSPRPTHAPRCPPAPTGRPAHRMAMVRREGAGHQRRNRHATFCADFIRRRRCAGRSPNHTSRLNLRHPATGGRGGDGGGRARCGGGLGEGVPVDQLA